MGLFVAICVGLGLSAACGLRVFLPLFVVSVAIKLGFLPGGTAYQLAPAFEWLGSTTAVVLFGTATVVELVGYLIPWVDHVLDLLAVPLSAAAGAVLMASQLLGQVQVVDPATQQAVLEPLMHPAVAWSLGIIAGATTAVGVEAASIAGRLSSSVLTIGWLNPIYGLVESVLAFAMTLLTILVPVLVGLLVMVFVPVLLIAVWRILAWRRRQRLAREEKLRKARERIAVAMAHHAHKVAGDTPA